MRIIFGCASAPYYPVRWKTTVEQWMALRTPEVELEWMPAWSANHSFNLNRILQACRERIDWDWLGSIETDIVPRVMPYEIGKILEEHIAQGRHIVSSGVQLEGDWEHPGLRRFGFDIGTFPVPDSETFFEVSRTSLGFVFFSKEAVLALKEIARAEQWGRSVPYYCLDVDLHPSGTVVGLDYSLCQRARDVGYSIYVDRRLRTMHLKEIGYPSFPGDADHTPAD